MLQSVKFVSQLHMEHRVVPSKNLAVISITTPGSSLARFDDKMFNSVLRLQFDDLYEEIIKEPVGAVPDLDPNGPILWHGLHLPDMSHAKAIVEFLNGLTCNNLVVHCHSGVSRSAAVAQFVSERYDADLSEEFGDTSCANKRLLRLLNKFYDGQLVQVGKYHPSGEMATVGDEDEFDFTYQWITSQVKNETT